MCKRTAINDEEATGATKEGFFFTPTLPLPGFSSDVIHWLTLPLSSSVLLSSVSVFRCLPHDIPESLLEDPCIQPIQDYNTSPHTTVYIYPRHATPRTIPSIHPSRPRALIHTIFFRHHSAVLTVSIHLLYAHARTTHPCCGARFSFFCCLVLSVSVSVFAILCHHVCLSVFSFEFSMFVVVLVVVFFLLSLVRVRVLHFLPRH